MIQYFDSPDLKRRIVDITDLLKFDHVHIESLYCVRSRGSKSNRTIARIHGLGRIWQEALGIQPAYIIEVISEKFDDMTKANQDKTLIHELLHVPHGFKGGFRHHKEYVNKETVETWYKRYVQKKRELRKI